MCACVYVYVRVRVCIYRALSDGAIGTFQGLVWPGQQPLIIFRAVPRADKHGEDSIRGPARHAPVSPCCSALRCGARAQGDRWQWGAKILKSTPYSDFYRVIVLGH
jgi:hypothetical protein